MTKDQFLEDIKNNCSEILYLSVDHIIKKKFNNNDKLDQNEIEQFFANYKNYHLYLNDFAGTIYSRYASSVNNLYIEMCNHLNIEIDNQYTLEHVILKLEKQTPELLLSLTDPDIQKQTIGNFDEKLINIQNSIHYNKNIEKYKDRVDRLINNITLVKNALQIS